MHADACFRTGNQNVEYQMENMKNTAKSRQLTDTVEKTWYTVYIKIFILNTHKQIITIAREDKL